MPLISKYQHRNRRSKNGTPASIRPKLRGQALDGREGQSHPDNRPEIRGSGDNAAYHSTFDVPLKVTSDGKTTLVTVENQPLQSGFQTALQHTLAPMAGKYSDYIVTPAIFELMPTLQAQKAKLRARLGVIVPIDSDGHYYFGSGCKAHY